MRPPRIYIVGTDTEVGKTTVAAALLAKLRAQHIAALPFKPAQSGNNPPADDATRLLQAADLSPALHQRIAPWRYHASLAPGVAEDPTLFLSDSPSSLEPLHHAALELTRLEQTHRPRVSIIEGAGGLWVPMPGGTWQPTWIDLLATHSLVVARPELGTINHTVLTLHALANLRPRVLGFVFSQHPHAPHDGHQNASIIARRTGHAYLGVLPPQSSATATPAAVPLALVDTVASLALPP